MIIKDDLSKILIGGKKALLVNPPIYDTQYWPRWSQPHGLLKIAAWLKAQRYSDLRLLDCLATDENRKVSYRLKKTIQRGNISRQLFEYGWPLSKLRGEFTRHATGELFRPDEIWITSIMTYWWESTRDIIRLAKEVFGSNCPRILVGGIYPTLYPEHADEYLSREADNVVIVPGEICSEAANAWTDLSLYNDDVYKTTPKYAIITGGRGCPFNCAYCAQLKLNDGRRNVRYRDPSDVAEEVAEKQTKFGIKEIAFYEDNLLFNREEFFGRLDAIDRKGLKFEIYAPEGIEPRLVDQELMSRMRRAGFKKIYLALETIDNSIARSWNRKQATIEKFENAVKVAIDCGFRVGAQELNAFVIFGLPDEDLQSVVNTALYANHRVGSVVPMLFTPVPGSILFEQHKNYLLNQMGWNLHELNGKLLPFLEYNRNNYPGLQASDYLDLESFMMRLNSSKVYSKRFDVAGDGHIANVFRACLRTF